MNHSDSRESLFSISMGADVPLKAYASPNEIPVIASFVAELTISQDRPTCMEKFYAVSNGRALLGRSTALRYSVLQLGLHVPISKFEENSDTEKGFPGEIWAVSSEEFPKFNVPPVQLSYDRSLPPTRNVFTSIPPAFKEETSRRLQDLLSSGIIEEVTEEMDKAFCSSLLVVPKGKSDIRLVVDLRGPNKCIIRTPFKMPTLESILVDLNGASWFSTVDLTSAFFHVELHSNSRHLTNFFAGNGIYRFVRLPFGLCNAPDVFQEILQTIVLADCKGTRNYLDDILVYGKSKSEHDENLNETLQRLKNHNVRINMKKCVFGQESVKFLGFVLSKDGMKVEDEKLKAVKQFRRPETQHEVKSFLGLVNFTERFILHRADKTEKLRSLAKSDHFYWTSAEEYEFNFLKEQALQEIVRLGYFRESDRTELFVDASPSGLGAVLVQYNEKDVPRIISCASKALSDIEKKYPQTQRESLAVVWGIERFTYYLTGKFFTVRTDSEANEFIFGNSHRISKRSISRAESWSLRLQSYNFEIKRVPGHLNVADALSRLIGKTQIDEPFDETSEKHLLYSINSGTMDISWQDIEVASESDETLNEVRKSIQTGKWPPNLTHFQAHFKEFRSVGSTLFRNDKIVLPKNLHASALESAHQGHLGGSAMKRIMREYFWWPNMNKTIEVYVKNCQTCLILSRKNPPIPLSSRDLPEGPWEILQVDFLSIKGFGYGELLMLVDTYSRYLCVAEMRQTDAKSTNRALSEIFYQWGLPLILQSDNGPPFQSDEFKEFWQNKGVRVRKSIPLCPQSNGSIERQNQGVIKALAAAKNEGRSWKSALFEYVHVHNTKKPHARLGITPFELLVGWQYRGVFPCLWDVRENQIDLQEIRDRDAVSKLVSKKYADSHRGAMESEIKEGDTVVMLVQKKSKTDPTYSKERYIVLKRIGAKVVIRSDRGVQYERNVQDVKIVPPTVINLEDDGTHGSDYVDDNYEVVMPNNDQDIALNNEEDDQSLSNDNDGNIVANRSLDSELNSTTRPRRNIRKPEKFKNMFLYHVFS
ncbi:uncharacterized protein K02A2.6-like [Uranotaenia lowii]|uniref:uncharacterized protein K02A2.6-like n=1 Tax=Uranotaenia lowii TaxID=190385 RepID=UPI0024783AA1|nr:uncharacterized protein K02A2.6-like [Uranotaenia lowii]